MSRKMTGFFKWKWGAISLALLAGAWGLFSDNAVDIYDKYLDASEKSHIASELERFKTESYIVDVVSDETGTSITYYTCKAPLLDYAISISINGEVVVKKEFDAADFPEKFTNECFEWTPSPHSFSLNPGDVLVVVWNYGEYGRFEMKWEEPDD